MKYLFITLLLISCGKETIVRKEIQYQYDVVEKPIETIVEIHTIVEQCTVEGVDSGTVIRCPDGTSSIVKNGTDGQDGQSGQDGEDGLDIQNYDYIPVGLIDPCGDKPGIYDEVFIKMANGTLVASFSNNVNGDYTRLSVLVPGTYMTTDGDSCTFTVTANNDIINESHQN